MYFRFLSALSLLTNLLFAQTPPPEQEQALRANVQKFYQSMQDGKFRGAYALVADDSQESFMEMAKPKYTEWKIDKIEWSEDFKKATVTLNVATELIVAAQRVPVKRLEDDEWVWFYVAPTTVRTPFGTVKVDPNAPNKQVNIKEKIATGATVADISKGLEILTPQPINLKKKEKSEIEIKVRNGLQGHVEIELQLPKLAGLSAATRAMKLKANEEGTFKIQWIPQGDKEPQAALQAAVASFPIGGIKSFLIHWID